MNEKLKSAAADLLFDGILQLKTREECYTLFSDLCTAHEVQSLAQRLDVAKLLREGETYQSIAAKTGASTATISRVNRSITDSSGGYDIVFERLKNKEGK